jgi:hypothetical protein
MRYKNQVKLGSVYAPPDLAVASGHAICMAGGCKLADYLEAYAGGGFLFKSNIL